MRAVLTLEVIQLGTAVVDRVGRVIIGREEVAPATSGAACPGAVTVTVTYEVTTRTDAAVAISVAIDRLSATINRGLKCIVEIVSVFLS